jgi:hypothetical protein
LQRTDRCGDLLIQAAPCVLGTDGYRERLLNESTKGLDNLITSVKETQRRPESIPEHPDNKDLAHWQIKTATQNYHTKWKNWKCHQLLIIPRISN